MRPLWRVSRWVTVSAIGYAETREGSKGHCRLITEPPSLPAEGSPMETAVATFLFRRCHEQHGRL